MTIEYIVGGGLIAFCGYMNYRGQKKVKAANDRVRLFSGELKTLGNPTPEDLDTLHKKYGLANVRANFNVGIPASFENPGPAGIEKTRYNKDGTIERFISDGTQWVPQ